MPGEKTIGHQGVEMRVPSGVIAEGLHGHHYAGNAVFALQMLPEEIDQTLVGAEAELARELAVIQKIPAENDRYIEDILPVRFRLQQVFLQMAAELHHFLGVTGGAEPAAPQLKASRYSW
ncbi:MAG: hypothetical protein P8130_05095 [Deltaproteobacteria bacterium]